MMDAVRGSPSDAAAAGGNSEKHSDMFVYFIIGVACAAVLLAGLLLVMHLQLRQAHQHLEKEKNIWGGPSTGGGLRGMWARARGAGRGAVGAGSSSSHGGHRHSDSPVPAQEQGGVQLQAAGDNDISNEDNGFF